MQGELVRHKIAANSNVCDQISLIYHNLSPVNVNNLSISRFLHNRKKHTQISLNVLVSIVYYYIAVLKRSTLKHFLGFLFPFFLQSKKWSSSVLLRLQDTLWHNQRSENLQRYFHQTFPSLSSIQRSHPWQNKIMKL